MKKESAKKSSGFSVSDTKYISLGMFLLFANLFFFRMIGNAGFALFTFGFWVYLLYLTKSANRFQSRNYALFSGLISVFSLLLISRAAPFVVFVLGFGITLTTGLFMVLAKDQMPFFRNLFEVLISPFEFVLAYLRGSLSVLGRFLSQETAGKNIKAVTPGKLSGFRSVVTGIVISFPVVAILLLLLSQADPVYGKFLADVGLNLGKIFRGDFWNNFIQRAVLTVFMGVMLLPLFHFFRYKSVFGKISQDIRKFSFADELKILLLLVAVILGSYLVVQWPYIFANVPYETDLSKFGVATYSEYVRRGFAEFILVSLIIYLVIWAGLISVRGTVSRAAVSVWIKRLQLFILGEFFIFLLSLFRRIYLYQAYHGWSLVRIYGGLFLVWVLCMSLTLAARHVRDNFPWVKLEAALSAFMLVCTGLLNAESFIVHTHPPTVNKRVDYVYLSKMSADGVDGWIQAFTYAKETLDPKKYDDARIIGEGDRTKIAYTGQILHNLTVNVHNLHFSYADAETLRSYFQEIITAEGRRRGIDQPVKLDIANPSQNFRQVYVPFWPPMIYFEEFNKPLISFYAIPGDNQFPHSDSYRSASANLLDRLYMFNVGTWRAYQTVGKEIPLPELLELQDRYISLFKKISSQPENERTINQDLSFSNPLL